MEPRAKAKEKLDKQSYKNTVVGFIRLSAFCSALYTLLIFSHTKELSTLLMFFGIIFAFLFTSIPIMLYYFPAIIIGYFLFKCTKNHYLRIAYIAISIPAYVLFNLSVFGNCKMAACSYIAVPAWIISIYMFIFTLPILLYAVLLIPKKWFNLKWETFFTILIALIIIYFIQPYLDLDKDIIPITTFLFGPFELLTGHSIDIGF